MRESSIRLLIHYKQNRCFFLFDLNPASATQSSLEKLTNLLLSLFGYNSFIHASLLNLNYSSGQLISGHVFAFFFPHDRFNQITAKLQVLNCMDRLCGIYMYDQFFNFANIFDLIQKTPSTLYIILFSLLYQRLCYKVFDLCQYLVISLRTIKK